MNDLSRQDQAAIEAVARHFSAPWENRGQRLLDAYLTIAGKRIAVEVTIIKESIPEPGSLTKPRLRFDRVALRVVGSLQAALGEVIPEGQTVIVTITAPIRLPSKTAAALEDMIRACLTRRSAPVEVKDSIHGNHIRIRVVKDVPTRMAKVIGFVHNPDSDPAVLLHLTQSLLQQVGAAAIKPAPRKWMGDRWLVVVNEDGVLPIQTYRHAYSQLAIPTDFKRILMVFAGGRVRDLD